MKKTMKYILFAACTIVAVQLQSCRKISDININPNQASKTHPQALLTKVEWDAFTTWHGTAPLYALKMIVQTDGANANQVYNWQRGSFDQYESLRAVVKMEEEATKLNLMNYHALAKFFRAYYFYHLTLTFGDIPYSEAGKGESEKLYTPKYDRQKDVFTGILTELKDANELLKKNAEKIEGDIIYKGDALAWRKLINSFRLKILLSLSNHSTGLPFDVKTEFAKIYTEEPLIADINGADDAKLVFINQDGNRYPEFNSSSYGSGMYMDSTFIKRLQDHHDPRLFLLATQTRVGKEAGKALNDFSSYEGGDPIVPYGQVNAKAVAGKVSKVHDRFHRSATNEPFVLLGSSEMKFILAEAMLNQWITGDTKATYNQGIEASFAFYEKYFPDLSSLGLPNLSMYVDRNQMLHYLNDPLVSLAQISDPNVIRERILMQKYLRSFHQGGYTAYFDHLRTGLPSFRKNENVKVAYRWMYPSDEYNFNRDRVAEAIQKQFNGNDNINLKTWWIQ